jgi:ornithine cyclodeaminase
MHTRLIGARDVARLLPMGECIAAMDKAFRTLVRGDAVLPLRPVVHLPDGSGALAAMPAYLGEPRALGLKLITVFPANHGGPLDSHQGVVIVCDPRTGHPSAILDASAITAIRTAAVSAVATRALARASAGDLAILGTGVQAMTHLEALACVSRLRRVRAWSRDRSNVDRFVARAQSRLSIDVEPAPSAESAVRGADIICTVTAAREPVLSGAWVADGAHVNAVGASVRSTREVDTELVRRAAVYVDRRESALAEAGDVLVPIAEGAIDPSHIRGELGELLEGRVRGRDVDADVTLFKSLGLAIEDLAAADIVLRNAVTEGAGQLVDFGTSHDAHG